MPRESTSTQEVARQSRLLEVPEETLVNDARAGLTPAQMVERKLATMLRTTIVPASHLQATRTRRALS